tara:strand:- start:1333 stop:2274 length:942 start_codon:yes stop_codon:yes gene_type:complete
MINILITGGTGFIGSNLCHYLLKNMDKVHIFCMDNNYSGSLLNIKNVINLPNFTFINHNIINTINFNFKKIDFIYHLACPASPISYQKDPLFTIKTCVYGTINILEIAKKYKSRILFSSTSEIYGDPNISPQVEEYWGNVNPIGIRSSYDEGKRLAETIMFEYNRKHKVDIRIIRIFNTYGPLMDKNDGRVVSNFINQALEEKDITIYGDGMQTRSFCYIDDLIIGIIKMMNNDYIGPINLGNPNEITIKKLANIILNKINTKSKIVFKELPNDDPKKRNPDITKAKNNLKWEPTINLNNGLNKTIEYFKNLK